MDGECAIVAESGVKYLWIFNDGYLDEEGVRHGSAILDLGGNTLKVYVAGSNGPFGHALVR